MLSAQGSHSHRARSLAFACHIRDFDGTEITRSKRIPRRQKQNVAGGHRKYRAGLRLAAVAVQRVAGQGDAEPLLGLRSGGSLFLATVTASFVAAAFLSRADAYLLSSLCSLGKQLKLLPMPLLAGAGSMIACLFFLRDDGPVFREWPFLWLFSSAILLIASRWYLSRLLNRWSRAGRLARRVAVIGAGEFSREFIERLRSEPSLYTVVGLYDDRLSRIPAVQDGVRVRGSVRDLLERSREEQIDQIVIALPLSAVSRISMILEQVGSAVADLCLTTDFVGFRYQE